MARQPRRIDPRIGSAGFQREHFAKGRQRQFVPVQGHQREAPRIHQIGIVLFEHRSAVR